MRLQHRLQHQVLSVTDPRAIGFILGEGTYYFPKPQGVRAWFKATLGEGILWVEGKCSKFLCLNSRLYRIQARKHMKISVGC